MSSGWQNIENKTQALLVDYLEGIINKEETLFHFSQLLKEIDDMLDEENE